MSSRWHDGVTRTFGSRVALWYFGLFVAGALLLLGVAYALLANSLRARDRDVVESTLIRYAQAYERRGLAGLDLALSADRSTGEYEPLFVRVLAPGGRGAAFFSMPAGWNDFDVAKLSAPPLLGQRPWAEVSATASAERLEVASVRLPTGELFQVGKSTRARDELLARFRGTAAVLLALILVAAILGGTTVTWSALRPVREMTAAVRSILETGSVRARVPVAATGDPLDEAGVLMNRMLDRIEALIAGLRGSLDNVAHDLRTPVARLRATAETALRAPRSPEEYRSALADCLEESERVVTILNALMDIAEAETGVMTLHPGELDLVPVVRSAVELYADVAEEKGVTIDIAAGAEVRVVADAARLRQAVANLVDNAVKYTPPGGRVVVSAAAEPGGAVVTVRDTGIGITAADRPRVWDRLYRGDQSRSERGLGLGLSLVKAIVEAHHGRVEVDSEPGKGSLFAIHIPTQAPEAPNMTPM